MDILYLLDNTNFKKIALADGIGGWSIGKAASDEAVGKLKEWFKQLSRVVVGVTKRDW